jgi:hypothetical protein
MSWVTGARRDYPPNLVIQDKMIAQIEFIKEPTQRKTMRKRKDKETGEEVEVEVTQTLCQIKYLGGSARSKRKGEDTLPAKMDETYTLWMGKTLLGAILDALDYKEGDDDPQLIGTKWKVWRGEVVFGGNRSYEAELLNPDFVPTPPTKEDEDEMVLAALLESMERIGDIDKPTWYDFCLDKGAKDEADAIRLTEILASRGQVRVESTQIVYTAEE